MRKLTQEEKDRVRAEFKFIPDPKKRRGFARWLFRIFLTDPKAPWDAVKNPTDPTDLM